MPKSALDNPLLLPILGLLAERSRRPYAVFAELRQRYPYLRVRNATVYTLLDTLKALRWAEARQDGDHEVLRATAAGAAALAGRVEREIRNADLAGGPAWMTALAYLSIMPAGSAASALRARAAGVADEAQRLRTAIDDAGAPEARMIEAHYLLARLDHDERWLTATASRIETGDLRWP